MGRHAAGPPSGDDLPHLSREDLGADPTGAEQSAADPATAVGPATPVPPPAGPRRPWRREALVLGTSAAVTTAAVLAWAVGEWWIAALGAVGVAAVVVAATWVARSVPAPE